MVTFIHHSAHKLQCLLLSALLLICAQTVFAGVSASVDRTQLSVGESLTLTITKPSSDTQVNLQALNQDFEVFGTSTSSSTTIYNGKMSSNYQTVTTLMPKHAGTVTIPALTVGSEHTQPITINIAKTTATSAGGEHGNIFMRASVTNKNVYINSPIIYHLKLYFAEEIQSGSLIPAKPKNFDLRPYGQQQNYSAQIEGKKYQVIEQQYMLTPKQAGKAIIPSMGFQGQVVSGNNNSFFSFPSSKTIRMLSNPININVKPIPAGVNPDAWLPASKVTLTSQWSPQATALTTGQPITRTITLTAVGITANNLPDLTFNTPSNLNAYPDQPTTSESLENGQLVATKTYKIAYIPTQIGQVKFSKISVPWWNSLTDKSEVAQIAAQQFLAKAGKVLPSLGMPTTTSAIAANHSTGNMAAMTSSSQGNVLWKVLTALFALLWLLTLLIGYLKRRPARTVDTKEIIMPFQSSTKVLLKKIHQACQANDSAAIQAALLIWAKEKWDNNSLLSLGELSELLANPALTKALSALEKSLYTQADYDNGTQLWNLLQAYLQQQPTSAAAKDLPDLYPS